MTSESFKRNNRTPSKLPLLGVTILINISLVIDLSQFIDPDPDVRYVAEHSRCNVMVVEDEEQLNKVENIQDMLPELQAIIQYTGFPRSVSKYHLCIQHY